MFVAVDKDSGKRVTSIAATWADRLDVLRGRAREGRLRCPGCDQPLWFRVGTKLRPHFAHRQSGACPLAHDSNEVQEAKALLYGWLEGKFPGRAELDFDFGIAGNKHPAGLVVEAGEGRWFAYWVFDRAKRNRVRLFETGEMRGVLHHVIHTESTHDEDGARIHLTASQREFASVSRYDAMKRAGIGHLHFLDSRDGTLRIYRGLDCVHPPAGHAWNVLHTDVLESALVSPKTGEIVLPADIETRDAFLEKRRARRKRRRRKRSKRRAESSGLPTEGLKPAPPDRKPKPEPKPKPKEPIEIPVRPAPPPRPFVDPPPPPPPPREELLINKPLRCVDCGTITSDWSQGTPGRGTCVCRDCAAKRHARLRGG